MYWLQSGSVFCVILRACAGGGVGCMCVWALCTCACGFFFGSFGGISVFLQVLMSRRLLRTLRLWWDDRKVREPVEGGDLDVALGRSVGLFCLHR